MYVRRVDTYMLTIRLRLLILAAQQKFPAAPDTTNGESPRLGEP